MKRCVAVCFIVVLFVSDEFFVCVGYRSWGVSALQCVAACCSVVRVLQYVSVCYSMMQCVAVWCSVAHVLQYVTVCCSPLQSVAVWSMYRFALQRVTACCSVSQCVATSPMIKGTFCTRSLVHRRRGLGIKNYDYNSFLVPIIDLPCSVISKWTKVDPRI